MASHSKKTMSIRKRKHARAGKNRKRDHRAAIRKAAAERVDVL